MLQVLDAVDLSKNEVNRGDGGQQSSGAIPLPRPTTQTAHSKVKGNSAKVKDTERLPYKNGRDSQQGGSKSRGDSNRPGWRADCKDLAQKLLFSEDSGEVKRPQKDQQNKHSNDAPASVSTLPCKETHNGQKAGSSSK